MRKSGYTLAEVLISLTIIGVLAATIAPLVNKFRPDATKVAYLNTYDNLTKSVYNLANDRGFYHIVTKVNGVDKEVTDYPLLDLVEHNDSKSGTAKLCNLLGRVYTTDTDALLTACSSQSQYNESNFKKTFADNKGTEYLFHSNYANNGEPKDFGTEIYFDVNAKGKPNCVYNEESCPNPDRFKVLVAPEGYIIAADSMGQAYLDSRVSLRKRDSKSYKIGDNKYKEVANLADWYERVKNGTAFPGLETADGTGTGDTTTVTGKKPEIPIDILDEGTQTGTVSGKYPGTITAGNNVTLPVYDGKYSITDDSSDEIPGPNINPRPNTGTEGESSSSSGGGVFNTDIDLGSPNPNLNGETGSVGNNNTVRQEKSNLQDPTTDFRGAY